MKTVIQVPIDRGLLERIDRQARIESLARAALIRLACERYLRAAERTEWERQYVEGYRRIPEVVSEAESAAWLLAADWPNDEWPEAPKKQS